MPGNPNSPTFPGVYIKEIPSGVRTITGVATSITAFIGRALKGLEDEPVTINSFSDFVRSYGGLWVQSNLGQVVNDFFLNGGSQAIIVRVSNGAKAAQIELPTNGAPPAPAPGPAPAPAPAPGPAPAPAPAPAVDKLTLVAASSGEWVNNLGAIVDHDTKDAKSAQPDPSLFNLTIVQIDPVTKQVTTLEKFFNVSIDDTNALYVPRVLKQSSQYVRVLKKAPGDIKDPNDPWVVPPVRPKESKDANGKVTPVAVTTKGTDGIALTSAQFTGTDKKGINALDNADLFNILCIPPYLDGQVPDVDPGVIAAAAKYCKDRRAMLLVDPPVDWNTKDTAKSGIAAIVGNIGSDNATNAAIFFPRFRKANPLLNNQVQDFVPCGAMAGIFARTDAQRGVWKAPAGLDASLTGAQALSVLLTDDDRRTALFIEESLFRGTQWVVFEPNDEPLWSQIRLNVGAFMHNLFVKGAFQGKTPREAYFVKCDSETTTQNDIDLGIVNIVVGFAPLKPAEFVIISIQQIAGQIQV